MINFKDNQQIHSSHRKQDEWDEVHSQLLGIQKKSTVTGDTSDPNEKEANEVAQKVASRESVQIHGNNGNEGSEKINRSPSLGGNLIVSREVALPYYYLPTQNAIVVYKSPKDDPTGVNRQKVEEHTDATPFEIIYPEDCYTFLVVTQAGFPDELVYSQLESANNTVKYSFTIKDKDAFAGTGWTGSQYEKVYNNLSGSSATYQGILKGFRGKATAAPYNLELNYAAAPGQKGSGTTTTSDLFGDSPDAKSTAMEGGSVSSYFNPKFDTREGLSGESRILNDLGRALNLAHEGVHASIFLEKGYDMYSKPTATHNLMSGDDYRIKIYNSLKEFSTKNGFAISDIDLETISWYGLVVSPTSIDNFITWYKSKGLTDTVFTDFEKVDYRNAANNTAVSALIKAFEKNKVETIIYNDPTDTARYMIK